MNILFVAHERNMGGASKSLVTLAQELQEKKHNITVVIPFKSGQVYQELKAKNIPVRRIFFGWWMMPMDWNPLMKLAFRFLHGMEWIAVWRIASLAQKKQIQVIHSNSSAIDVGARAAKKAGIAHVWHFREFGDLDYRLEYLAGREKSCEYIRKSGGTVVFISQNLRKYYEAEIPQEQGRVIYNGISKHFLSEKEAAAPDNGTTKTVTFLISGNLHRNKRQDLAIEACRILKNRGFENLKLIIAGGTSAMADSKAFEKELREAAQKELTGIVEFTGYVTDMVSLRRRADVELVCSSREAFGRVTVEAMMASNPVIASDAGANPELIRPGENGFLFEEGNAQALADCMQRYLECPEQIRSMGENAYRFASEHFPSERNTEQIEALYRELRGNE